jgi:hypothetical protein
MNTSSINTTTIDGRLLMAALAKLTTVEGYRDKEPDEVLNGCVTLADQMFTEPLPMAVPQAVPVGPTFEERLRHLINCNDVECMSDTPDFILAKYIIGSLKVWDETVKARDKWYNIKCHGSLVEVSDFTRYVDRSNDLDPGIFSSMHHGE